LDLHHRAYNLLSTISRRPEPYHREFTSALAAGTTVEESGKIYSIHEAVKIKARDYSGPIIYDRWPRSSLTDHFIGGDVTLAGYEGETYADEGDFAGQPYECRLQRQGKGIKIILGRTADIATNQGPMKLRVEKTVTAGLEMEVLEVDYMFTNMGGKVLESVFAGEWNINLLGGGHNPGAYCQAGEGIEMRLDSRAELTETEKLLIGNNLLGIELKLRLDRRLTLWLFPVESLSNSEGGIEQVYQCSCIVILLPLILGPGQHAVFHYEWTTSGAGAVK
jgi:alpha-amylase